jgi:uncharacterized protein YifN (PemK superfamily)
MHMPLTPVPGMVLSYSYLWNREHGKGETEGRKDRPSVVVLVINRTPGDVVYVLPTSTSEPEDGDPWTIEIPRSIKARLKLDERRSWINVTEFNIFTWTGYHLRPTKLLSGTPKPTQETCLYGYLPNAFLEKVDGTGR